MYMIIDNLNRKIKQNQKGLNIILMNLILIIKIDDENKLFIRYEIYYRAIKFVFKRV